MTRFLDSLDASNSLAAAVNDTSSGKSYFVDIPFNRVADLVFVDIDNDAASVSEPTAQANSLADTALEPSSSVAIDPPIVALPAGTVCLLVRLLKRLLFLMFPCRLWLQITGVLTRLWFGSPISLHLDCSFELWYFGVHPCIAINIPITCGFSLVFVSFLSFIFVVFSQHTLGSP